MELTILLKANKEDAFELGFPLTVVPEKAITMSRPEGL